MARRKTGRPVHGWVILDKPVGMTSTRAVSAVRRIFDARKAGHGGTLDPLATGLLPIALGEATKTVSFVMDGAKTYRFTVRWGIGTTTDDTEGEPTATSDVRPSRAAIEAVLPRFAGTISQVPPRFSAVKVAGERAYDLARDGGEPELDAREVRIDRLDLVEMAGADETVFEADCGKGTYVRSLARDLGRALGTFAHVTALRRTRVAGFGEDDMISLEKLEELSHIAAGQETLADVLCSMETALDDIPALAVSGADAARLMRGQAVILRGRDAPILHGTVLVASGGNPVALAEMKQGALHPKRVFNLAG
ncbi:MAG TPA: tRNA pseudouridine(55) synthase TruB [Alphaproteobacteria bacterium]